MQNPANTLKRSLCALSQEQLIELVLELEARNLALEVEKERGRRWWPEDLFCPQCDKPFLHWNGRRTLCLLCER
jgi:hypothetical protein